MRAFKKSLLGIFTFVFAAALFITSNVNVKAAVIEEYSNTQAANIVSLISDGDYSIDELVDTLQEGGTFLESLYYMDSIAREDMYIEIRSAGVYELETYSRYYFIQEMIKLNNSTIITVEDVEQLQSLLDIHLELVQFYSWFDLDDDEVAEIEERVANSLCVEAGLNGVSGLSNYEAYLKSQSSLDIDKLLTQLKVFPTVFGEDFMILEEAFRNIINDTFKISSADSESEVTDSEEYVGNIGGTETTRPYERDTSKVTEKLTSMMNGGSTFKEVVEYWLNCKYPLESLHLVDLDTKAKYFNKITAQELEEFKMHVKYEILREMIWYDELSEKEPLRELDTNTLGAYYDIYMNMVQATDESITKEQLEKAESNVLNRELTLLEYDTAKTIPSIDKLEVYLDSTTDLLASEIFSRIEELNVVNSTATLYDIQNFKDYIYDIYGFSNLKEQAQEKIKQLENTPSTLANYTVTGYTKQVHSWGLKSGRFTIDYNYLAMCCRYNRSSTPAWTVMSGSETYNEWFRKIAYYGYGGPGDQWSGVVSARGHNSVDARIETAIALSDANIGLSATNVKDKYEQLYWHVNNNWNALPSPPSNFHVIYCTSPSTSYQDLIFWYQDPVYTVTYNSNHSSATYYGSTTFSDSIIYNTNYYTRGNMFSTPTGRYFAGWNESRNGGGTSWTDWIGRAWQYSRNYNTTLYAQWGYNSYSITYNLNGGTNHSSNPSSYTYNTGVSSFYNPSRTGYTFQGWYNNSDTRITSISASQTGNITLNARWTPTPYTITYDLGGGTAPSGVNYTTSYNIEQSVGVPVDPVHPQDFIFLGWFTDSAHTVKFTGISKGTTGNKTIYASWLDPKNIAGTYIDGINGSDSNSGLAPNAPVKTFKRAYTIAQNTGGTIYVVNQVTISSSMTLDKTYYKDSSSNVNIADGYEVKIMRYSKPSNGEDGFQVASYTGTMLRVQSYGELTIQDIEINGHRQAITEGNKNNIAPGITSNCGPIIQVWGLVDDDTTDDASSWEEAFPGVVTMNKGSVINNTGMAFHIGEIQASGEVIINDGYIGGHYNNSQGECEDYGVIVNHSELTINGGTIDNNYGEYYAGAIYNQYNYTGDWAVFTPSTLKITNGTFSNNNGMDGGVIYNMGGELTISGGLFENNKARVSGHNAWDNYTNCGGGAISNSNTMTITGGTFRNNSANHGGAILTTGGNKISNATFDYNTANYWGGAIFSANSGLTITNCSFTGNYSIHNGGALYLDCNSYSGSSTSKITSSEFYENSGYNGGAIYAEGNNLTVSKTNFISNISHFDPKDNSLMGNGGAIRIGRDSYYDEWDGSWTYTTSSLHTTECAFTENSTDGYGGATYIDSYTVYESVSDDFNSNFAYWSGGAIDFNSDTNTLIVSGGKFNSNISGETGGAISNSSSAFSLIESEFINNTASYYDGWTGCGGAILSTKTFMMTGTNNIEYSSTNNEIALWNSTTKIVQMDYPDFTQTYLGRITPDSYTVGRVIVEFLSSDLMGSDILSKPSISLTPYNNYVLRGGDNIYGTLSNTVVISEKYNITYNDSGASGTVGMPENGIKYWNEDYIISNNIPTSASGTFLGWDTSMIDTSAGATPTYTQNNNRLAYNINADTTLYAAWDYVDGAYVDGINGDDSNDGKSPDKAVKTFRKAYENIKDEGGTIFIVDTVNIDKNMTLTKTSYTDELGTINLADGKTTSILRYARPTAWETLTDFTHESNLDDMIIINKDVEFNLNNIVVDGHLNSITSGNSKETSDGVEDTSLLARMILIIQGKLNINNSYLRNNNSSLVMVETVDEDDNVVVNIANSELDNTLYDSVISLTALNDTSYVPEVTINNSKILTCENGTSIVNDIGELTINNSILHSYSDYEPLRNSYNAYLTGCEIYSYSTAISNEGYLKIDNCNIHDSIDYTAVLNLTTGTIDIINSTLSNNCTSNNDGGALYNQGIANIKESIFIDNRVDTSGGAIYNTGTLAISSSTFEGNSATSGGVIYNEGTLDMIDMSEFTNNTASDYASSIVNIGTAAVNMVASDSGRSSIRNEGEMVINYYENKANPNLHIDQCGELEIKNFKLENAKKMFINTSAYSTGKTIIQDGLLIDYYSESNPIWHNGGKLIINGGEFSNIYTGYDGGLLFNMSYTEINGGTFNNISSNKNGGVICNLGAFYNPELIINGGTFTNNSAQYGGVINNTSGNVTITDGTFTDNIARDAGGALFMLDGNVTISGGEFINNQGPLEGDLLYVSADSTVNISGGTFKEHKNSYLIYSYGTVNISDGLFDDNYQILNNSSGAIVGNLNISGGEFINNNSSYSSMGSVIKNYGNAIIENATFSNNGENSETGGVIHNQSQMFIDNCTFDGNTSANGGAIYNTAKEEKASGLYDADGNKLYTWQELIDDGFIGVNDYRLNSASSDILNYGTLVIDESITLIDESAFEWSNITNVIIPDSVTSIGDYAFWDCSNLESVRLPNNIKSIEPYTFQGCSSLKNVNIPDSVTTIGESAFDGCSSLETINIPDSVTALGDCAFSGSGIKYMVIPDNTTYIGECAFFGCDSLKYVRLPNSLSIISAQMFSQSAIEYIEMPQHVDQIDASAFDQCMNLTYINIPATITLINSDAFFGCKSLSTIYFDGPQALYDSLNVDLSETNNAFVVCSDTPAGLYDENNNLIVDWESSGIDTTCSNATTVIQNTYTNTRKVVISSNVTTISYSGFELCDNLTSIIIPNSVTTIDDYAFAYSPNLMSIVIPDSVTSIGNYVFNGWYSLKSIMISDNVTTIGSGSFYGSGLTQIILPNSLNYIGSEAFAWSENLEAIYYKGTEEQWNNITKVIDWDTGAGCSTSSGTYKLICLDATPEPLTLEDFNINTTEIAGALTIQNSIFTNNSATSSGGAVYNTGDMEIIGCTFDGNSSATGGAIQDINSTSSVSIRNSEFKNNNASTSGGAIFCQLGKVALVNCKLYNNNANYGGAILVFGASTIDNCELYNNKAEIDGGAIYNPRGTVVVNNSTINNNNAMNFGGAIYNQTSLSINNTLISNNVASLGNAIYDTIMPYITYKLNISGSTKIDTNNDIYLASASAYITVTGELTEDFVARITPNEYTLGRTVVKVDNLSQDIPYSVASEIYEKFELEPFDVFALRPGDYINDEEGIADTDVIISEAYNVTYDLNTQEAKVENAPVNQTKYWSEDLQLSTEYPKAPGFNFLGWDENINLDTSLYEPAYQPGDYYTENRDINLYGNWSLNMTAAYIDGINGNDAWSGATPSNPVKTFEQAYKNLQSKGGTIYVVGNVPISEDTTLDMSYYSDEDDTVTMNDGTMVIIKRYSKPTDWDTLDNASDYNVESYLGYLITVNNGATLTTENITIDGHCTELVSEEPTLAADGLVANESLILVNNGGRLNVIWSTLMNNYLDTSADSYGGAVFNNGYTYIDFPSIQNNIAKFGGAFYNSGSGTLEIAYIESVGNEAIQGGVTYNVGTLIINGGLNVTNEALEGGVLVNYGTVDITESSMSMNHAVNFGGAIVNGGTINANLLALTENRSDDYAGALLNNTSGTFNMTEGSFESNTAETYGGAVFNLGNMTLTDSHVFNNTTGTWGNLNNNVFGTLTLNNVEAYNNIANKHGGVLFNTGTLAVNGGNYHNNSAVEQGGVLYNGVYSDGWRGTATITGDAIFENNSSGYGGAIVNYNTLTIESGTFKLNSATDGGALGNGDGSGSGTITMIGGSITENNATYGGGIKNTGIFNHYGGHIDNNTAEKGAGIYNTSTGIVNVEESRLGPGLYDENDNLVASWDELVNTYGLDIESDNTTSTTTTASILTNKNLKSGVKLIIKEGIEYIGRFAFYNCNNLESIVLPNSLKTLSYNAMNTCGIKSIVIPSTVESIKMNSVYNCRYLTEVYFLHTDTLPEIGINAFYKDEGDICTFYFKNSKVASNFSTNYYKGSHGTISTSYDW